MESWIHTSKNSSTGDSTVDITVDSNKMSDIGRPSFQRTGTIMISTPQILKEYSIKQEGDMVLIEFEDFNYDGTDFSISAIVVDGQKFQVTTQNGVLICPQTNEILNLIQGKTIFGEAKLPSQDMWLPIIALKLGGTRITMNVAFALIYANSIVLKTMSIFSQL